MNFLREQFEGWDRQTGIMLLSSALLMVLFAYQGHPGFLLQNFDHLSFVQEQPDFSSQLYRFLFTFVAFFLIPIAIVKFVFRRELKDFGLTWGDRRFGWRFVAISLLVLPIPLYFSTSSPEFLQEYPLWKNVGQSPGNYVLWIGFYFFYYLGWEFLFRGFMQFPLEGRMAPFFIIMMQTLPSTLIHIGKPEGETIAAIVGGLVFGVVALRTRSILYPLLVHWYIGALTELFTFLHL